MKHTFSELHDHVVQIFHHYNVLHPNLLPYSDKVIPVDENYNLKLGQRSGADRTNTSIIYSLENKKNSSNLLLSIDQDKKDEKSGRVRLGQTDYHRYISTENAEAIVDKFSLEDIILKESAKLQKTLGYDFTQDFTKRIVFIATNETKLTIAKDKNSTLITVDFSEKTYEKDSKINLLYNWRDLAETLNIFQSPNKRHGFALFVDGTDEQVKNDVNNFFNKVKSVPESLFHEHIAGPVKILQSDMEEINNFVNNLNKTNKLNTPK